MAMIPIGGASLFVKIMGQGSPLLLMHGGPGVDHSTMLSLRPCSRDFQLIFYDHRCNGRSTGAEVATMTWQNLTADADELRQLLGFERWAVLGHSFGGMVALEYALRFPQRVSHLILMDTGADIGWVQENAVKTLQRRGFDLQTVALARRFFRGEIEPKEMLLAMRRFGGAYYHQPSWSLLLREMLIGLRMKTRPEALIFGYSTLLKDWDIMDRLGEIQPPTLVMAGEHDFQFPPEHQRALAAAIPNASLRIIDQAGHNVQSEKPEIVVDEINNFLKG